MQHLYSAAKALGYRRKLAFVRSGRTPGWYLGNEFLGRDAREAMIVIDQKRRERMTEPRYRRTVELTPEEFSLWQKAQKLAKKDKMTMHGLIVKLLREYVGGKDDGQVG